MSLHDATVISTTTYVGGRTSTTTDFENKKITKTTDYLGRIVEVEEHDATGAAKTTSYAYNAAGDLLRIHPSAAQCTTSSTCGDVVFTPDTLGRPGTITDPDLGTREYHYESYGNLEWIKDARARAANAPWSVHFTYDELDRMGTRAGADGISVTYVYDTAVNGIGRLGWADAEDASGTVRLRTVDEYDALGRVRRETVSVRGAATALTTKTEYDLAGRIGAIEYPGSTPFRIAYEYYPGLNELKSVTGPSATPFATFSDYELGGRIGTIVYGNAVSTHYYYDPSSLMLTGIRTWRGLLQDAVNVGYEVAGGGSLRATEDYVLGAQVGAGALRLDYVYDSVDRLRGEKVSTAPSTWASIKTISYLPHTSLAHTFRAAKVDVAEYAWGYDENGNTKIGYDLASETSIAKRGFTYGSDNLPTQITRERSGVIATTSFAYAGENTRVYKEDSTGKISYVSPLYEIVKGNPVRWIFANGLRIAMIDGSGAVYYLHKDRLQSTVAVTDSSGALAWSGSYTPFGLLRGEATPKLTAAQVRYLYTDHEYDPETQLYYFGARYYDPAIGRFITPDDTIPDRYDPQSLNRYAYALNNPYKYVDPTGKFSVVPSIWGEEGGPLQWGAEWLAQKMADVSIDESWPIEVRASAAAVGTLACLFDVETTEKTGMVLGMAGSMRMVGDSPAARGAAGASPKIARITPGSLPAAEEAAVLQTLTHIEAGTTPGGALANRWGIPFKNWAGDLPGARGATSPYLEYRVAPPPGTSGAGQLRLVKNQSTGEIYYTWTHYGDMGTPAFVKIR